MNDCTITLIHPDDEKDEMTEVFATANPIGRDEFQSAGVNGFKARRQFVMWAEEYDEQPELLFTGERLSIYRTYGPRPDGKIELYTAERVGNNGR